MDSFEMQNKFLPLAPPTRNKLHVKNRFLLILELIWLHILIAPYSLLAIFRMIFPSAEKSLEGQVVLVTGSGRGFGKGLALGFAKEGCKVAVADVNKANAIETAAEIVRSGGIAKSYFVNVAKVRDVKELRAAVTKELGPVDILVNNAGLIHGGSLADYTDEEIQGVIAVNLTSHFWMVREFLPAMRERNSGHIVAISSVAAFYNNVANSSAYIATKLGVRVLARLTLSGRALYKVGPKYEKLLLPTSRLTTKMQQLILPRAVVGDIPAGQKPLTQVLRLSDGQGFMNNTAGFMDALRAELKLKGDNNIKTTTVYPYFINTSAHYTDHWNLRLPAISIDEAVGATLSGVKRNVVNFSIPGYIIYLANLTRILPQHILDKSMEILYFKIIPSTAEVKDTLPSTAIIKELAKQELYI